MIEALRDQELLAGGHPGWPHCSTLLGREPPLGGRAFFGSVTPFLRERPLPAREDLAQRQTLPQRHVKVADDHPAQDLEVATEALVGQAGDQDSRRATGLRDVDRLTGCGRIR